MPHKMINNYFAALEQLRTINNDDPFAFAQARQGVANVTAKLLSNLLMQQEAKSDKQYNIAFYVVSKLLHPGENFDTAGLKPFNYRFLLLLSDSIWSKYFGSENEVHMKILKIIATQTIGKYEPIKNHRIIGEEQGIEAVIIALQYLTSKVGCANNTVPKSVIALIDSKSQYLNDAFDHLNSQLTEKGKEQLLNRLERIYVENYFNAKISPTREWLLSKIPFAAKSTEANNYSPFLETANATPFITEDDLDDFLSDSSANSATKKPVISNPSSPSFFAVPLEETVIRGGTNLKMDDELTQLRQTYSLSTQ